MIRCAVVAIVVIGACSSRREAPAPAVVEARDGGGARVVDAAAVAQIGEQVITADMLARRRRQIDMSYPGQSSPEGALAQLVQGYLAVEILRREGIVLDRATWVAERDRIERQTRDRERLERIKALYADDEDAYLRVGILPDFARSRLERYHRDTPRFADGPRQAAAALLDEVEAQPADFAARAQAHGGMVERRLVDPAAPDDREAAARLITLLADLPPGSVHPRTLETPAGFSAVRLLGRRDSGVIEIELALFPRTDFHAWFWAQARDVPVTVHDAALRDAFVAGVPWARDLRPMR